MMLPTCSNCNAPRPSGAVTTGVCAEDDALVFLPASYLEKVRSAKR